MDRIAYMEIGLDPSNSVKKRLRCTNYRAITPVQVSDKTIQVNLIITLSLGSMGTDCVIMRLLTIDIIAK